MPNIKHYIIFIFIAACYHSYAQPKNDSVFSYSQLSSVKLTDVEKRKSVCIPASGNLQVFVFLSPECPLCQNYTGLLNKLNQQYAGKVRLYGIIPGRTFTVESVTAFARKYKITYPLLIDASLELSHYLQASITPEVIFLNDKNELVYKGAIDNWLKDLGKQRVKVTENYLLDAIGQNLAHQPAGIKRVKAVGCLINDF
jgi:thiol-disulfide isomerase/thioredoxin